MGSFFIQERYLFTKPIIHIAFKLNNVTFKEAGIIW